MVEINTNMKKRFISVSLLVSLCVGNMWITAPTSAAAINGINITVPTFQVTMNGEVINNDYSKYPLIVYKGITYFPMTYSDCRFLGIESTWMGNSTGLLIDSTGITAAYNPDLSKAKNRKSYSATIPGFPIRVNGKTIDNSKEAYPIISFRDITYFPMTWKYCVDQFSWDYKFDDKGGLVIESSNVKLDQIPISKDRLDAGEDYYGKKSIAVIAKNGYCYYIDKNGAVIQASLSDTSKTKNVFKIWPYNNHAFYEENGKAMLFFHSGGAVIGSDHRYILKEDGTTQKIQSGYDETTLIGDKLYMYYIGPTPGPWNLWVKDSPGIYDGDVGRLGARDYWYYFLCDIKGLPKLELIGNELYVRAAKVLQSDNDDPPYALDDPAVYKVNVSSNAVSRVSQAKEKVLNAQIAGEYLYYICAEGEERQYTFSVYRHSLKDASETFIGEFNGKDSWRIPFAVVGEHVYYGNDGTLYCLPGNESLNPHAEVVSISVTGDNREYLACTFRETPNSKYRIMVFDQSGKVVFKTSDSGSNIIVEGNLLYFYNITTETLCKTILR